jgi:hypothetical protein
MGDAAEEYKDGQDAGEAGHKEHKPARLAEILLQLPVINKRNWLEFRTAIKEIAYLYSWPPHILHIDGEGELGHNERPEHE